MNDTPHTPTAAENSGNFDPQQAAALLERATQQARRKLAPTAPALWTFRAVLVLLAFGSLWLSVRGQHPYTGRPSGWALAVIFTLVAINIGWTTLAIKRAGTGVSGPAQRTRNTWIGVMLAVLIAAYAVTVPLYHAGASHPVWALYPASAPWLIVGLVGAAIAAALRYWPTVGTLTAIAMVAAAAGFDGPASAWLIMGIGMCAVCLGTAAFTAWQQHRSVVLP